MHPGLSVGIRHAHLGLESVGISERTDLNMWPKSVTNPSVAPRATTEHRNLTFVLGVSRRLEDVQFRRRSDPYHRRDETFALLQHLVRGVDDVSVERDEPIGVTRQDGDVADTTQEHDGSIARISKPFGRRWRLHCAEARSSSGGGD